MTRKRAGACVFVISDMLCVGGGLSAANERNT